MSRPQAPHASVIHKRRRKRQFPSPEYLRRRRRDPASPEPCQNIRLRSRVTCPRDPSQCLIRKFVNPQHGLGQICQPSPPRPLHLDRQSLVGWPRFPADRTLSESAWPTSRPVPRNWLARWTCVRGQMRARSKPTDVGVSGHTIHLFKTSDRARTESRPSAVNNIRLCSCMASGQVSRSRTIARFISAITVTSGASASRRVCAKLAPENLAWQVSPRFPAELPYNRGTGLHTLT